MSTTTLIAILMVPLVVMGVVAFALIIAFAHQVSRVTAELDAKKRPEGGAPVQPEEPPVPEPEEGAPGGSAGATAGGAGGTEPGAADGPDPPPDR